MNRQLNFAFPMSVCSVVVTRERPLSIGPKSSRKSRMGTDCSCCEPLSFGNSGLTSSRSWWPLTAGSSPSYRRAKPSSIKDRKENEFFGFFRHGLPRCPCHVYKRWLKRVVVLRDNLRNSDPSTSGRVDLRPGWVVFLRAASCLHL